MMALSELVAQAHLIRARDKARMMARSRACPVYIVRTLRGLRLTQSQPIAGEHWCVSPAGQFEHIAGPVF